MRSAVLAFTIALGSAHAPALAQQKPDLSGEWLLNASKSDFGIIPPPQCVGLRIAHKDPAITIEETDARGALCALKLTYVIDGPAVTFTNAAGIRQRARAAWVGAAVVTQRVGDDDITIRVASSISADGKTLVRDLHAEAPQGSTDWTYVYDRVSGLQ